MSQRQNPFSNIGKDPELQRRFAQGLLAARRECEAASADRTRTPARKGNHWRQLRHMLRNLGYQPAKE